MGDLINAEIDALLQDTSRSFFVTLKMLPKAIRRQVGLLYLLARVADTIADTKTGSANHLIGSLSQYDAVAQGDSKNLPDFSEIASLQEHEGEARLMENVGKAVSALELFDDHDKKLMRECLAVIISGQTLDLNRFGPANESGSISPLQTDLELDDYAYRVAGSVGDFWTHMTYNHLLNRKYKFCFSKYTKDEIRERLFSLGIRFGKALQMINILRDIPEDLRFGRCYIPAESIQEIGLKPSDLIDPSNMEKFRPLYNRYLDITDAHLDAAVEYISMLPYSEFRLRAACMLPVLIGQRTVAMLREKNVLDPENRVKISRAEMKNFISKTKRSLILPGGGRRLMISNRNR